ncbi:ATP-binding protein [Flagellimonas aurea]|uniref:sensor histidine kinase n=1 Tax=Flagellimonas aurea TaxID=2915619 RepID=UPI0035CF6949
MSTENGLVRYDGQNFKLFNDTNIKGLDSNRMKFFEGNMVTDSLFSVNNAGNVILIHNRRATVTNDQSHNFQPLFRKLKNYWNTPPPQPIQLVKNNFMRHVLRDKSFFLVGNNAIKKYSKSGTLISTHNHTFSDSIQFFTKDDNLFALDKSGRFTMFKENRSVPIHADLPFDSNALIYANNVSNQVFLYSNNKLYDLTFTDKTVSGKIILEGIDFNTSRIYSVYYDQKNEITYLGSLTRGLCIAKKQYFQNIPTNTKTKDAIEYAINKLNDSTLVTATGVEIQNRKLVAQYEMITENSLRYIAQLDSSKNLWISKGETLSKFYANSSYTNYESVQLSEKIRSALIQGNNLWIGTGPEKNKNGQGILFVQDLGNPKIAPTPILRTPQMITSLAKESDSIMFVGTHQGLYRFNQKDHRTSLVKGLEKAYIRSMYPSENELWISTYEDGFFLYRDSQIWSFPLDKNRYLATAHCIIEDIKGYLWITTNKGLFQVYKNDLMAYLENNAKPIYYHYYDKNSGFSNNEFNGGGCPCGVQLPNQDIVFPSLDGLVFFNPSSVNPKVPDNDLYIDEIIVDGKHKFVGDTITLKKKDRIIFKVTSPFFGNPYNSQIEIRMDDGAWEPIGTSQTLSYTNLDPGQHFIRARRLAGFNAGYRYTSISVYVAPTFWQSTFFKALLILLLCTITYLTIILRTRYVIKKNVQLKKKINEHTLQLQHTVHMLRETKEDLKNQVSKQRKLVTAITHDIKTPLRFLTLTSKYSFDNFKRLSNGEFHESVKVMYTSSYQLSHFIENVLDYSFISLDSEKLDKDNFSLFNLIEEKIKFFETISASRKLKVDNQVPSSLSLSYNQQLFSIIIHNLLDNSIKHTYDGKIVFWHQKEEDRLTLNIEDTGSGMTAETKAYLYAKKMSIANGSYKQQFKQKGFGLSIVMELLMLLEGDITVKSEIGKGTLISISLNINH